MRSLKQKISHEFALFNQLEDRTKRFLLSVVGYGVADILLFTFAYALMFSQTQSMVAAAVFNVAFYLTLMLAFYFNGRLLRKIAAKTLFILGGLLQGAVLVTLFFFPPINLMQIAVFGLVFGIPLGFYWGNRNTLYLYFTNDDNRHYFEGLRRLFSDPLTAIAPLLAGWFIVFYQNSALGFNKIHAYQIVALIGFTLLAISMVGLIKLSFPQIRVTNFRIAKLTQHWKFFRLFVVISSFQFSLVLSLPETLTLKYLGNEGILGTLKMLFVILSAAMFYFLGKQTKANSRATILKLSTWPLIAAAILVFLKTTPLTITIYLLTMAISDSIFWFVYYPIFSKAIEKETADNKKYEYAYVFDHEIFIDSGRILATFGYFLIVYLLGDERGVMLAILVGAVMQLLSLFFATKVLKTPSSPPSLC